MPRGGLNHYDPVILASPDLRPSLSRQGLEIPEAPLHTTILRKFKSSGWTPMLFSERLLHSNLLFVRTLVSLETVQSKNEDNLWLRDMGTTQA